MVKLDKNIILSGIAILAIIITGVLVFVNMSGNTAFSFLNLPFSMSKDAVAKKSIDYINANLLNPGNTANLLNSQYESGMVKISLNVNGNQLAAYASKDGKLLFINPPSKIDEPFVNPNAPLTAEQIKKTCDVTPKVDKPMLDVYIVSQCPYGLQIQRAMDNAIANIPALADYMQVRYIGDIVNGKITAMHGDAEAQENLRQICIRDEQRSKYWAYVSCYIKEGDGAACQASEKIDSDKLEGCVKDSNRGLAYAKEDFDLNKKYKVTGSPTILLNGVVASEFSYGGRSSDAIKKMITCSSNAELPFASIELNTQPAATSYSTTYAGAGSSANNAANCAPATN